MPVFGAHFGAHRGFLADFRPLPHFKLAGLRGSRRMEAGVGIGLCSRFSYEEDTGFPSERQELFAITRHYFSLLFQYFH
jgi:hypothetical protein